MIYWLKASSRAGFFYISTDSQKDLTSITFSVNATDFEDAVEMFQILAMGKSHK